MALSALTAQPGRVGRVSYDTGRQRQRIGKLLDLGDPETAWALALGYQRNYPDKALRLDVLASSTATWQTPALASYELRDYLNGGLAGTSAAAPTPNAAPAQLPTMSSLQPTYPLAQQPAYPPVVVHPQQAPSMTEPPRNMDEYGQFLFRQQGQLLQVERNKVLMLEQQVQLVQQQMLTQKEELDTVKMDLRLKEHELKLKDALRDQRDEFEGDKPSGGLSGLSEALSSGPLAGVLAGLAQKFLLNDAPATPVAGPAVEGEMAQVMAGLAELLPNAETGTKVYMALSRLLPHPGGLDQLLQLAGV